MPTTATEYLRGHNTRSENRNCRGSSDTTPPTHLRYEYGPLRVLIRNRDLGYVFDLEPAARVYTAYRANEYGGPVWAKPRAAQPTKPSGKTVHNHIETIDTGERKEMFGYTARRVITKTRQTRDAQPLSESQSDGWYIDPPPAWANLHPPPKPGSFWYLTAGTMERDDYKFTEIGNRENGFALLTTKTHTSFSTDNGENSRTYESIHREEVTEFSEAPLEPALFVPPLDFKRVLQFSDEASYTLVQQLRLRLRLRPRWEMMKDAVSLPGRIAKFTA